MTAEGKENVLGAFFAAVRVRQSRFPRHSLRPDRPALPLAFRHEGAGLSLPAALFTFPPNALPAAAVGQKGGVPAGSPSEAEPRPAQKAGRGGRSEHRRPPDVIAARRRRFRSGPLGAMAARAALRQTARLASSGALLQVRAAACPPPPPPLLALLSGALVAGPVPRRRFPPRFLRRCCSGRPPSG